MKHVISCAIAMVLLISSTANASGLLPSLTDAYGVAMPSLGDVLDRYPDRETKESDGSTVQTWNNVNNEDFEEFSEHLDTEGTSLLDYTVLDGVFTAQIGKNGKIFTFVYNPEKQTAVVSYPKGTYDERNYAAESHYNLALQLMSHGNYQKAVEEFGKIKDNLLYKDVDSLLKNNDSLSEEATRAARIASCRNVGNYVTFGTYPQSASGTDSTPIEWLVLEYDVTKNRTLLLSRYGLDVKPYNEINVAITWEKCTLRSWLNEEFINKAFTVGEQKEILITSVDNSNKQGYSKWNTKGGNNTQDKIFLLSIAEAIKYVGIIYHDRNNTEYCVAPTAYALQAGAKTSDSNKTEDGTAAGWWLLRSPGIAWDFVANVCPDGSLGSYYINNANYVVRPALWINLESSDF